MVDFKDSIQVVELKKKASFLEVAKSRYNPDTKLRENLVSLSVKVKGTAREEAERHVDELLIKLDAEELREEASNVYSDYD